MIRLSKLILVSSILISTCSPPEAGDNSKNKREESGKVTFLCSDAELTNTFIWAKEKALSYLYYDDPVGNWYEASLPGREAFCMRDLAHQINGASVLGLSELNFNMLYRFAENISESKDWCTYWEINRYNNPAPVDYENDNDFWYNLPANFDIVDACYRQFLWTGDMRYISDTVFTNFYSKSLNEYVDRWDLGEDKVLFRDRYINLVYDIENDNSRFHMNRGIPGYHEGASDSPMRLGVDLSAAQLAAYIAYVNMMSVAGEEEEVQKFSMIRDSFSHFVDSLWWDDKSGRYKTILYEDGTYEYLPADGRTNYTHYLLHFDLPLDKLKSRSIIDSYIEHGDNYIVEIKSHLPEIFFRSGKTTRAITLLKELAAETNKRRDYPENPFTIVGAVVTGLMGMTPEASNRTVTTISRLENDESWAQIEKLPVLSNQISLKHNGKELSQLTNMDGETFNWKAGFPGSHDLLLVNGKIVDSTVATDHAGNQYSYVVVKVKPGKTVVISAK